MISRIEIYCLHISISGLSPAMPKFVRNWNFQMNNNRLDKGQVSKMRMMHSIMFQVIEKKNEIETNVQNYFMSNTNATLKYFESILTILDAWFITQECFKVNFQKF